MSGFTLRRSYKFGATINGSGNEYKIVKMEAPVGGKPIVALSGAGDIDGIGVVQDIGLGSLGQTAGVCVGGVCKVKLGDAFTPGTTRALFKSDAAGLAVPATDDDFAIGYLTFADEGSAYASGDIVEAVVALSNKAS